MIFVQVKSWEKCKIGVWHKGQWDNIFMFHNSSHFEGDIRSHGAVAQVHNDYLQLKYFIIGHKDMQIVQSRNPSALLFLYLLLICWSTELYIWLTFIVSVLKSFYGEEQQYVSLKLELLIYWFT